MISEVHANFIINEDNATANDIVELIKLVKDTVSQKFEILLELEITTLGFNDGAFNE